MTVRPYPSNSLVYHLGTSAGVEDVDAQLALLYRTSGQANSSQFDVIYKANEEREQTRIGRRTMLRKIVAVAIGAMIVVVGLEIKEAEAQDPLTTALAPTVGAEILNASGIIDDIMDDAASKANYIVFNAAMQVRLLLENFRLSAKDILDSGFDSLNNSQQQVFDNIQKSIASLKSAIEQPLEAARQTVEEIHQITASVTFENPSILRSTPTVIGPAKRDQVTFTIRGISLDEANPKLYFGKVQAKRVDLKKQQVMFTAPSNLFAPSEEDVEIVSGKFSLEFEDCTLFVFCKTIKREFELGVLVLPAKLADVEVLFSTKSEQKIYKEQVFEKRFNKNTGDLTKFKCETFNQGPHEPGYFIDVATLRTKSYETACPFPASGWLKGLRAKLCPNGKFVHPGAHGNAGHRWKFLSQSPAGFSVELCAKSEINKLDKKHGEMTVNLTWREFKLDDVVSPVMAAQTEKALGWNSAISLQLPQDAHAITVRLYYFDGTQGHFIGNASDRYSAVTWNAGTRQLLLRSSKPDSISEIY